MVTGLKQHLKWLIVVDFMYKYVALNAVGQQDGTLS